MKFKEWLIMSDIQKYIEYKAKSDGITVEQAAVRSMARLFSQIQDETKIIVIMTSFRNGISLKDNRNSNLSLANDIRQLGWGYTPVLGGFVETGDNGEKITVKEESFFINTDGNEKQVTEQILQLLKKYNQEAALLNIFNKTILLSINGEKTDVGQWKPDPELMATYYTRMRKGPPNRQFKFEMAGDDSIMTRMAVDYFRN